MTGERAERAVYIHTWGCQMNEHKSEGIAGVLAREGYVLTDDPAQADLVIFNTCMVREKAEDKVLSKAGEIRKLKEQNPELLLGIGGCMAQALKGELARRVPAADFLFGSSQIGEIPRLVQEAQRRNGRPNLRPVMAVERLPTQLEDLPFVRASPFRARITITEGCDNFCSFCIVPYTTGRLRSRLPGEILEEARALADRGYKEVQLLGQNVDSYGKDLEDPQITFANLLRAFTRLAIPRVRFTSSHPKDITDGVIAVMGQKNNICEHLHMAAQSGSDRLLEEMRRGYTKERFLKLVRDLKDHVPGVNITTDLIVGYPGETEADFEETVDLVEKARFGGAYIFKYSPRPGTISAVKSQDDVPPSEKQRRLQHLLALQKRITAQEHRKRTGEIVEVLVESCAREPGKLLGKTRDHVTVVFPGREEWIGRLVPVRVRAADVSGLFGEALRGPVSVSVSASVSI